MWNFMSNNYADVMVRSSDEGIKRVKDGSYAYLLESLTNDYVRQRNCELMQVGSLLDQKGYGIGTPQGSPWRDKISNAILLLQEKGDIQELYTKWWEREDIHTDQKCEETSEKKDSLNELSLSYVSGVFVVTFGGLFLSFFITFMEFLWKAKNSADKNNVHLNDNFRNGFKRTMQNFFKSEFGNPFFKKMTETSTTTPQNDEKLQQENELGKSGEQHEMTSVSNESSRRSSRKEMKRVSSRDSTTDKEARDDGEDSDNNLPYTQPSNTVASNVKVIKKRDKSPRYTYTLVNDDYLATVENPNSLDPNGIYSVNYGNNMKSRSNAHRLNTNI
jgi:hypothetical protein